MEHAKMCKLPRNPSANLNSSRLCLILTSLLCTPMGAGVTTSVTDAFDHAVHSQFRDGYDATVGSKRAAVHVMPTNTELQELGMRPEGTQVADAKTSFQKAVYVFFGLPNSNHIQDEQSKTHSTPSLHREQCSNILHVQNTLERLDEAVYARSFGLEADAVVFRLRARGGMLIALATTIISYF